MSNKNFNNNPNKISNLLTILTSVTFNNIASINCLQLLIKCYLILLMLIKVKQSENDINSTIKYQVNIFLIVSNIINVSINQSYLMIQSEYHGKCQN